MPIVGGPGIKVKDLIDSGKATTELLLNINSERQIIEKSGGLPTAKELIPKGPNDAPLAADRFTEKRLVGAFDPIKFSLKNSPFLDGSNSSSDIDGTNYIWWVYRSLLDAMLSMFDIENLPEGLNKSDFLGFLFEAGSGAMLRMKKEGSQAYYLFSFETVERDIFDKPSKIKIQTTNKESLLNGYVVPKDKFTIIKWNRDAMSLYVRLLPYLKKLELAYSQLARQLNMVNGKWIISDKFSDNDNLADSQGVQMENLQAMLLDPNQPFIPINQGWDLKNNIVPLQPNIVLDEVTKAFDKIFEMIKMNCGIMSSSVLNKKERTTASDINAEQGLNMMIKESIFNYLKDGIDEANKKFGLNITIELHEQQQALEKGDKENGDMNNEQQNG